MRFSGKKKRIVPGKPWFLWPILRKRFVGDQKREDIFVAFGRRIYAEKPMSLPLAEHEVVHLQRQGFSYFGAIIWWWRYLREPAFRYNEELVAFRNQYLMFKKIERDRNVRSLYARDLAIKLSGALYGGVVPFHQALKEITEYWSSYE